MYTSEIWAPIVDFIDYEISNFGRVRHIRFNRQLAINNSDRYSLVGLHKNGIRYWKYIHRLVIEAFDGPISIDKEINHIDGNKQNNMLSNLECISRSENMKHAYKNNLKQPSGPHPIQEIIIIETGVKYSNIHECARSIDGDPSTIAKCLKGYYPSHKGYTFKYCRDS